MRAVVISMPNLMIAEGLKNSFRRTGEMVPMLDDHAHPEKALLLCMAAEAEVLLMGVSGAEGFRLEDREKLISDVRDRVPSCKLAMVVDETESETLAERVKELKRLGRIDAFFYTSSSLAYLTDCVEVM